MPVFHKNWFYFGHCWLILCYKRQDSPVFFLVCWAAGFLSSKCTSERASWIKFLGYPLSRRCVLNCWTRSSKNVLEELVLRSLRASILASIDNWSLFLLQMGGTWERAFTEKFQLAWSEYEHQVLTKPGISRLCKQLCSTNWSLFVNLIVGWWLFNCSMKFVLPSFIYNFFLNMHCNIKAASI